MESKQLKYIQIALWLIVYTMLVVYFIQKNDLLLGSILSVNFILFYTFAVYFNANYLIVKYFHKNKIRTYFTFVLIALLVTTLLRVESENLIRFFYIDIPHSFYNRNLLHYFFVLITQLLAFLFGFLLRISIDYVELFKKQQLLKTQQLATEIKLLKAQVQPHFLFNTLNNIYSLAVTKSDKTPEVVAKLSDIMRYFVDDAPKEKVSVETEVNFLKNYIELEKIRMVFPLQLEMNLKIENYQQVIPPMLLIAFVENIFKHGIDKTERENQATIDLEINAQGLVFVVKNKIFNQTEGQWRSLANLEKRLALLFEKRFEMKIFQENDCFVASLNIQF